MRIGAFEFTPGIWPTIGAAAMIALTVHLGSWQTDRGDEKQARQALLEARTREPAVVVAGPVASADAILYRRVSATGHWVAEGQIFIDNQVFEGRAGFRVITPLRIEGGKEMLLVDRGWIERTAQYPKAPRVAVPEVTALVTGVAVLPPRRYLELSNETIEGDVWQNLSIERYRSSTGRSVLPFIVVADTAAPGLIAVHERPDTGVARHREYSLTWYAFAATTLGLWLALNIRRAR